MAITQFIANSTQSANEYYNEQLKNITVLAKKKLLGPEKIRTDFG